MNHEILSAGIIFHLPRADTAADLAEHKAIVAALARRAIDLLRDDESAQRLLAIRGIYLSDEVFITSL